MSGLFHISVSLTPEKYFPLPTEGGGSLGHMAGADGLEKRKISCPRGEQSHNSSVVQTVF